MPEPQTNAGKALLEAFTTHQDSPDFAIRISEESVVRHAVPRIEAEAVEQERARLLARFDRYKGWMTDAERGAVAAVLFVIEEMTPDERGRIAERGREIVAQHPEWAEKLADA